MDCLEDKVFAWIESIGLFEKIDRMLLAVSGGADSVVMVHVLERLRQAGRLQCEFVVGHVNHGLRGADSDGDEVFVKALARQFGMDIATQRVPVREYAAQHKLSIETAGRVLRLKSLAAMATEHHCAAIATAHHADDQAETLVHRLLRGTGFRGLCGIRPVSIVYGAKFTRPLLAVRRNDIIRYAERNGIQWRHDASNSSMTFTRNRIRHRLLPVLEADSRNMVGSLCELSEKSRQFQARVEQQAEAVFAEGRMDAVKGAYVIDATLLCECLPWMFYEVMRQILVAMGVGLRGYSRKHFNTMRQLVQQTKAKTEFPNNVEVIVDVGKVFVRCRPEAAVSGSHQPCEVILPVGQTVRFGQRMIKATLLDRADVDIEQFLCTKDCFVEWFDADKICGKIEIRNRRDGDRFWPIGARSPKKVGRFLLDAQLDAGIRQNAFVITDDEQILWLAPMRMSEQVKMTKQTTHILEIRINT